MKKQISFSFKPTRFLVFHFAIWSSVILFVLYTIWVIKASPSVPQETNLQFNKSSLGPITVQTLTGFSGNSSVTVANSSIWIDTHFRQPENASGFGGISVTSGLQREDNESKVPEDEETKGGDFKGNFPTMTESILGNLTVKNEVSYSGKIKEKSDRATPLNKTDFPTSKIIGEKKKNPISFGKTIISSTIGGNGIKGCDFTNGRWVYDERYPLYTNNSCPFIDEGFNCQGNGRSDQNYIKWRWQPQDCDIPRYYIFHIFLKFFQTVIVVL